MKIQNSSNLEEIFFQGDDLGTLVVTFKSGKTYRYNDVPRSHYDSLVMAQDQGESVGRRFNALRFPRDFDFADITDEAEPLLQKFRELEELES